MYLGVRLSSPRRPEQIQVFLRQPIVIRHEAEKSVGSLEHLHVSVVSLLLLP